MAAAALSARIRRLGRLSLGVAREAQLLRQADIFLYVERRESSAAPQRLRGGRRPRHPGQAVQRLDGKA
jgi:hypothetical protein